jgi:DNA-binding MarR family transcriptional regulator
LNASKGHNPGGRPKRPRKVDAAKLLEAAEGLRGTADADRVAARFGVTRRTVYKWLERLVDRGLLKAETVPGDGNPTMWTPTDLGRKVLAEPSKWKRTARAQHLTRRAVARPNQRLQREIDGEQAEPAPERPRRFSDLAREAQARPRRFSDPR